MKNRKRPKRHYFYMFCILLMLIPPGVLVEQEITEYQELILWTLTFIQVPIGILAIEYTFFRYSKE